MVNIVKFYGATWCSDCKRTKQFLGEQRIPYLDSWIDVDKDEEASKIVMGYSNGKRKIPVLVFDDGSYMVEPSNAELMKKFGLKTEVCHEFHDVVVIGGGPAGLTSALYLARDGYDVVVIERASLGGQASFTDRLDNYPGFPEGIKGSELADRIVKQCQRFGVEFMKATEVIDVRSINGYLTAITSAGDEIGARAMIIATGSKYKMLNVPGESELIGYRLHFCSTCDGPFYRDQNLAVIGGGNSAFEESVFLAQFAKKVTIYGKHNEWKASKVILDEVIREPNIDCVLNAEVTEIEIGPGKSLAGVRIRNTQSGEEYTIKPDGVFLFIGLIPNAAPIKHLVEFDDGGFVVTDSNMMTKTSGLFVVGDARSGSVKQAVSAMGEGAAAAIQIREYLKST